MCEGKSFHVHAPVTGKKGATSNSRKSDGRNRQTIGGRGLKSSKCLCVKCLNDSLCFHKLHAHVQRFQDKHLFSRDCC